MRTFLLAAWGPFWLAASIRFLKGFTPAAFTGQRASRSSSRSRSREPGRVRAREHPRGVECEIASPAAPEPELRAGVRVQVARILPLDVDESAASAPRRPGPRRPQRQ